MMTSSPDCLILTRAFWTSSTRHLSPTNMERPADRHYAFFVEWEPLLLLWCCRRIGRWGHRISRRGLLGFGLGLLRLRFCLFLWSGRFSGRSQITLRASVGHRQHACWRSYRCSRCHKVKQPSARNDLRCDWFAHGNPLTLYTPRWRQRVWPLNE